MNTLSLTLLSFPCHVYKVRAELGEMKDSWWFGLVSETLSVFTRKRNPTITKPVSCL